MGMIDNSPEWYRDIARSRKIVDRFNKNNKDRNKPRKRKKIREVDPEDLRAALVYLIKTGIGHDVQRIRKALSYKDLASFSEGIMDDVVREYLQLKPKKLVKRLNDVDHPTNLNALLAASYKDVLVALAKTPTSDFKSFNQINSWFHSNAVGKLREKDESGVFFLDQLCNELIQPGYPHGYVVIDLLRRSGLFTYVTPEVISQTVLGLLALDQEHLDRIIIGILKDGIDQKLHEGVNRKFMRNLLLDISCVNTERSANVLTEFYGFNRSVLEQNGVGFIEGGSTKFALSMKALFVYVGKAEERKGIPIHIKIGRETFSGFDCLRSAQKAFRLDSKDCDGERKTNGPRSKVPFPRPNVKVFLDTISNRAVEPPQQDTALGR